MGRAPCCEKNELKKGPWTAEEDQLLIEYIKKHGYGNWRTLPKNAGLQRCGKSCRLRWTNYLRPDIKRGKLSFEEEQTIIQLHGILGNKWSAIAARLPGRTDNEIKNYWNTHIRKKLLRMGIDPTTHTFRRDLLDFSTILSSSPYNNSTPQLKISGLLRMQHSMNPELMRLASSFLSSHHQNRDFLNNSQTHNQIPPSIVQMQSPSQDFTIPTNTTPCGPISGHDQAHQIMHYEDVLNFGAGFGSENCKVDDWEQGNGSLLSGLTEDCILPATNYVYNGSGQPVVDPTPSSDTCTFQSNSSNSFSFQSVFSNFSSPLSSQGPLQFEFDLQC